MRTSRSAKRAVEAAIGYAADPRGNGIAYARVAADAGEYLLRIPFRLARLARLNDREVGYAALTAVANALTARGVRRAAFALDDTRFIDEIVAHREMPQPLVLPYIRLRCALNAFDAFSVRPARTHDLAQRAQAEAALHVAA